MKKIIVRLRYPVFYILLALALYTSLKGNLLKPGGYSLWTIAAVAFIALLVIEVAACEITSLVPTRKSVEKPETPLTEFAKSDETVCEQKAETNSEPHSNAAVNPVLERVKRA